MKKYCIVIFLISISFFFSQNNEEPDYIPAPDFTLPLFNSKSVLSKDTSITLSSLKGNVVLLNFWATWCGPCIAEIPEFNDLYNKYKMEGLEILGVSVSDNYRQLEKFTKKIDVQYKLLFGTTDNMSSVMQDYGNVYSVPISFLINRDGLVVRGYPGAIIGEYWSSLLKDDILKFLAIPYSNNSLDTIKVID